MKNAIIVTNHTESKFVVQVENFSDSNVKQAIKKALKIDESCLQCLSASVSYSLYGIKELVPSLQAKMENLIYVEGYYSVLEIQYCKMIL